jgi:ubiquinone biosynthesis monooxygenase Coq6
MPDDHVSLVWSTTSTMAKRLISLPPRSFIALVNAAFRLSNVDLEYLSTLTSSDEIEKEIQWRESLLKEDENTFPPRIIAMEESSRAAFPLKLNHVDEYTAPRVALVGDAAHSIHPLAGQGLNLGLADVKSLSSVVQQSLSLGQDIGSFHVVQVLLLGSIVALSRYPLQRYFQNHRMLGVCDKLHKLYSFDSALAIKLRSWGLEAVNEIGPLKRFIVQSASQ